MIALATDNLDVFPAHAGVIPEILQPIKVPFSIPRTRGGDPNCRRW